MARPFKPDAEKRSRRIKFWLTAAEARHIVSQAKQAGLSRHIFSRDAALGNRKALNLRKPRRHKKPPFGRSARLTFVHYAVTPAEFRRLHKAAGTASLSVHDLARQRALGRRPKAKSKRRRMVERLLYELIKVATNLRQLELALDDADYGEFAALYCGRVSKALIDAKKIVLPRFESLADQINAAGHTINVLAAKANAGQEITPEQKNDALRPMAHVLQPVIDALGGMDALNAKGLKKPRTGIQV